MTQIATSYWCWRHIIALAKIYVCATCDREQRLAAPDAGSDGCTCYEDLYEPHNLCHGCDGDWLTWVHDNLAAPPMRNIHSLQIVGNRMTYSRTTASRNTNALPLCPCSRGRKALKRYPTRVPKFANAMRKPFPGHHRLLFGDRRRPRDPKTRLECTQQCVVCLGYVVPARKRSARIKSVRRGTQRTGRLWELGPDGRARVQR
ncbi:hypothetical protein ACLMJK_002790 [Lecanora helva]